MRRCGRYSLTLFAIRYMYEFGFEFRIYLFCLFLKALLTEAEAIVHTLKYIYIILNWIESNQVRKWNWINLNSSWQQTHYKPSFKTSLFIQFRKNDHLFGEFFRSHTWSVVIFLLFCFIKNECQHSSKNCSLSSHFFGIGSICIQMNSVTDVHYNTNKFLISIELINGCIPSDSRQFWVDVATFLLTSQLFYLVLVLLLLLLANTSPTHKYNIYNTYNNVI